MSALKGRGIYNVVVIGAGTAGLVTVAGTAGLGGRVALIERRHMGGDCLNYGCVPSKALISSARAVQTIWEAEKWGLERQEPLFAFTVGCPLEMDRDRRGHCRSSDSGAHVARQRVADALQRVDRPTRWRGMVIYAFVYVLAALLFMPGSALTAGAGFAFGIVWGTLVVSLSATTAAALAFLIARYVARDWIVAKAERDERFRAIDRAVGREGWKIVGLLRLSPAIPFNLSNYLYGLTSVRFWPYVLVSWVGMLPGTLLYVYLGAAGKAGLQATSGVGSQRGPLEYGLFGAGLLSTVIVTAMVTRIARKALQQ